MAGTGPNDTFEVDDVRRVIERAVRRAVAGAISIDQAVREAITAAAAVQMALSPAQRMARRSAELLAEYDALGADRASASKVGRRHGNDPLEREHIAQHVRRLARRRKANPVRLPLAD